MQQARIRLPGREAAGATDWGEQLQGDLDELLAATREPREREKLLGAGALADLTLPLALSAGVGPRSPSEDGSKVSP